MTTQAPVSIEPKPRWLRIGLRTLLVAVVVLGLVLGGIKAVPWVMWRHRVDQAIEAARSAVAIEDPPRDDILDLLSDRERVVGELLRTVERDPNDVRRINAMRTIRALLKPFCPPALRKRCLDQALELAARGRPSPTLENELARAISDWVSFTGLDAGQRATILARAKAATEVPLAGWAHVLAEIGGREEILVLVGLGNVHDPTLLEAIHNSGLTGCRWPGLLPRRIWLDDPVVAPWVLRYSLLSHTPEGREILIAYATDASRPVEIRRQAIEALQKTIPGTKLLLRAADAPDTLAVLGASIEGDPRTTFRAALTKLEEWNGRALWSELIEGLDRRPRNRFSRSAVAIQQAAGEADDRPREHTWSTSLRCLQWISGRTDIRSEAEWREWYQTDRPPALSQSALVKLVLEHPEALDNAAILRRIVPDHLAALPDECVPLYDRMAREGSPASRYWACTALLICTPRTDVVSIAIDLIGSSQPGDVGTPSWGPIELLKRRFAENFFWDTTAWRGWWAERGRRP